ncbi:DNA-binding response regulator [uncultured Neptuniibacter sp.]|uniref:helix-turn-helix transcriptional regulator n=1 Tax=uncultured Neptuniibacter sp. TaxID=502143 RepID=UPI0026192DC0|nr:DNA-binding response regulator [uncultured Neptuniibacter sp.]
MSREKLIVAFLSLVVVASGADLLTDLSQGASRIHLIQETILLSFAFTILIWLFVENVHKKREIANLKAELESVQTLPTPQSAELVTARKQLGEAINTQFTEWKLSQSERDVGLLLIKGFSLKEIALLRGTAEKTIRQQASSIYQKSGLAGRHVLAAWFIEDLL